MTHDPLRMLLDRRALLGAFAASASSVAFGGVCGAPTEPNIEGPFYRPHSPVRAELVRPGDVGQRLEIVGQVRDASCRPIPGAIVDIWQADGSGAYDNESAEMRLRGHVLTDVDGRYRVLSVVPGRYLNGRRFRPAHVHYKVGVDGRERLTTQLYFEGDEFIKGDAFVHPSLVRPMLTDDKSAHVEFDLVIG